MSTLDPPTLDPHLTTLTTSIDTLTSVLQPLLKSPLTHTLSTLPLLDKAKLYIHLCYTIESLLYSSLLLSGAEPKKHAVFAELARLRKYYQKVKDLEEGPEKKEEEAKEESRLRLDKHAAGRFVRAGLAGNERFDEERRRHEERVRERAEGKMRELDARKHIRFDDADNEEVSTATTTTTPREQDIEAENEELYGNDNNAGTDTAANRQEPSEPKTEKSKKRKAKADRKSSKKKRKSEQGAEGLGAQDEEGLETVLPARQAARPQGEMFKSLLERPAGKKGGKGA